MKTVRWVVAVSCSALSGLAAYACGGSTTGNVDDAGAGADAASDTSAGDSGLTDGPSQDAGACASYVTESCDAGCPLGTVCVREAVVDTEVEHGCYPLPTGCDKASACGCIANCVCPTEFVTACSEQNGGVDCQSGTVSRREFKKDIDYVDDEERASLAAQALRTSLAEYRYKTEPESAKKRLGFIIDDMPNPSPAIASDRTHVDDYGYTSMLLATVQEQQKQIDALKQAVSELSARKQKILKK